MFPNNLTPITGIKIITSPFISEDDVILMSPKTYEKFKRWIDTVGRFIDLRKNITQSSEGGAK